jgi:LexA DNA binding domain-containing protein
MQTGSRLLIRPLATEGALDAAPILADVKGVKHRFSRGERFPAVDTLNDDTDSLSETLAGRCISHIDPVEAGGIAIRFADGTHLTVTPDVAGFSLHFHAGPRRAALPGQPSARQREYLEFIVRYLARFGVAPAESDIERHFMVSAPSVNQMLKTLERRGFIARGRDFTGQARPRSIRVLIDLAP